MDPNRLRELLLAIQAGSVSPEDALARLRRLPFEDLGYARLDTHRALRAGAPEAVYCPGKSPDQIVGILGRLAESHANVLATRATPEVHAVATEAGLRVAWHPPPGSSSRIPSRPRASAWSSWSARGRRISPSRRRRR